MNILRRKNIKIDVSFDNTMAISVKHSSKENNIYFEIQNAKLINNKTDDRLCGDMFERSIDLLPVRSKANSGSCRIFFNDEEVARIGWTTIGTRCSVHHNKKIVGSLPMSIAPILSDASMAYFNAGFMIIDDAVFIGSQTHTEGSLSLKVLASAPQVDPKWQVRNAIVLTSLTSSQGLNKNIRIVPCLTNGAISIAFNGSSHPVLFWSADDADDGLINFENAYDRRATLSPISNEWRDILTEEDISDIYNDIKEMTERIEKLSNTNILDDALIMKATEILFDQVGGLEEIDKLGVGEYDRLFNSIKSSLSIKDVSFSEINDSKHDRNETIKSLKESIARLQDVLAKHNL